MKYYCVDCGREYTIPQGDYLIEKREPCKCGQSADLLALKKYLIVESRLEYIPTALFLK